LLYASGRNQQEILKLAARNGTFNAYETFLKHLLRIMTAYPVSWKTSSDAATTATRVEQIEARQAYVL
jgi:hypothetical protein